jgi:hypothetical protein
LRGGAPVDVSVEAGWVMPTNKTEAANTLGLDEGTTDKGIIKQAYRILALVWHPDKSSDPNAQVNFQAIGAAHTILMADDDAADAGADDGIPRATQGRPSTGRIQWVIPAEWDRTNLKKEIAGGWLSGGLIGKHIQYGWRDWTRDFINRLCEGWEARSFIEQSYAFHTHTTPEIQTFIDSNQIQYMLPTLWEEKYRTAWVWGGTRVGDSQTSCSQGHDGMAATMGLSGQELYDAQVLDYLIKVSFDLQTGTDVSVSSKK